MRHHLRGDGQRPRALRRLQHGLPDGAALRRQHLPLDLRDGADHLRPIVLAPQCLGCHGKVAELAPGVAAVLAQRYPGDLATGYAADFGRNAQAGIPEPETRNYVRNLTSLGMNLKF